jgi:hypothetical protein
VNMNDSWMRILVPMISSRSYELRQMLAIKYELKEVLHNI